MLNLVHLSFNPNLHCKRSQPLSKRTERIYIEAYPDIERAMWGLYDQVLTYFHDNAEDFVDLSAYSLRLGKLTHFLNNYCVIEDRLRMDAHVSDVVLVDQAVELFKTHHVRVYQDQTNVARFFVPFQDAKHDMILKTCSTRYQVLNAY